MATTVAVLEARLTADTRDFDRGLDRSQGTMRKTGQAAKVMGLAIFAGLAVTAKRGFDELKSQQEVMAQTAAGIKSTGGVANVTAKSMKTLTDRLGDLSGIDDELIQKGANLLLTFKKVRNEVGANNDIFNRATESALDLSVRGFGSMDSTSKMLGKALEDPIKGLTALGKAGVTFSAEQKEAIKTMIAHGDQLGAQKLIMAEVESQVRGSAKAYGETLSGMIGRAMNAFDDFAANVVGAVIPALLGATSFIGDHVLPRLKDLAGGVADLIMPKLRDFAAFIRDSVIPVLGAIVDKIRTVVIPALQAWTSELKDKLTPAWKELKAVGKDTILDMARTTKEQEGPLTQTWKNLKQIFFELKQTMSSWLIYVVAIFLPGASFLVTLFKTNLYEAILKYAIIAFEHLTGWVQTTLSWFNKLIKRVEDLIGFLKKIKMPDLPSKDPRDWFSGDPGDASMMFPGGGAGAGGLVPGIMDELAGGRAFGLTLSSGVRPGAVTKHGTPSDHATGRAIDMVGSHAQKSAFFRWLIGQRDVKQAFYDPLGSIFGGVLSSYREGGHSDHVHVATYDQGGWLKPGLTLAANNTGRPERVVAPSEAWQPTATELLMRVWKSVSSHFHSSLSPRFRIHPQDSWVDGRMVYISEAALASLSRGGAFGQHIALHEMAHVYQTPRVLGDLPLSEGAADAFAHLAGPEAFGSSWAGRYRMWPDSYVKKGMSRGAAWVLEGQFLKSLKTQAYDRGGMLPTGLSLAYNGTGTAERVGGGGGDTIFNFPNYVGSKSELMSWLQNAAAEFQRRNNRPAFGGA